MDAVEPLSNEDIQRILMPYAAEHVDRLLSSNRRLVLYALNGIDGSAGERLQKLCSS